MFTMILSMKLWFQIQDIQTILTREKKYSLCVIGFVIGLRTEDISPLRRVHLFDRFI